VAGPELKFIIGAVDNASKVLANVGKETEKLGAATAKMNAASRLIGAGAIIAFGAASVKAYAEAEKQQVKLEEAYRKFPAIASVNIASMRALNDAIQAKTGTDNDDLAAAEAKLAMYNLTGEQIQKLIPLVNDYAIANNVGIGEAAGKVGKAMLGNAKALKDVGINFKATGDKAKDFQTIYDALNSKVGGAGEAFGKTTEGQLKILSVTFQDLQEEVGAQLVPALQSLVNVAVPVLSAFGKLPEPVKSATVMIAGAAAAALLLGPRLIMLGTALRGLVPASAEAVVALESESAAAATAGRVSSGAATKIGTLAKGLGAIAIAVVALKEGGDWLTKWAGDSAQETDKASESLKTFAASTIDANSQLSVFGGSANTLGDALHGTFNRSILENVAAFGTWASSLGGILPWANEAKDAVANARVQFEGLDTALAAQVTSGNGKEAATTFSQIAAAATAQGISIETLKTVFPHYASALDDSAAATKGLAGATGDAAGEIGTFTETVASSVDKTKLLADTASSLKGRLESLGGPAINLDDAMSKLYKSFDDATAAMKDLNGATNKGHTALDLHSESGRKAQEALAGIATAADGVVSAQIAAGASTAQITQTQKDARNAFIDAAKAAGITGTAAGDLADSYGLIPGQVATTIKVNALDMVKQAVLNYIANLKDIPEERRTQIITEYVTEGSKPKRPTIGATTGGVGQGAGAATGGYISGAGTGTSDSIPAMLSNGEFVIRASSAARLGMGFLNDLNDNGQIDGRRHFALGGSALLARFVSANALAISAEQELKRLGDQKSQQVQSTAANIGSFASLPNAFSMGAYANAQANVTSARQRLNLATTPQERASAQAELDQAEAAARDTKPTVGNIIKGLQAKLTKITTFNKNLKTLAANGVPFSFLRQLVAAGPDEGGDFAQTLLSAGKGSTSIKDLIRISKQIDEQSVGVGAQDSVFTFDPLIIKQRAKVDAAITKATASRDLVVRTNLTVDGKALAEALVVYKRAIGGRSLGLS
jgi:hypothetical protein